MRVHLSFAAETDVTVAASVLAELGATVSTSEDVWLLDDHLADDLGRIEAVVAVFSGLGLDRGGSVHFDAGVAVGRGLPLLVLSEEASPFALLLGDIRGTRLAELRGNIGNREALRFHLALFLNDLEDYIPRAAGEESARTPSGVAGTRLDIQALRRRFEQLRPDSPIGRGLQLEELLVEMFRESGLDVAPAQQEHRGFDFVATTPSLKMQGRPLVVEVKSLSRPRELDRAALALQNLVLQERAGLALLLFDDTRLPTGFALSVVPMVISLGIGELFQRLETAPLLDVLLQARNEAVHRL